MSSHHLLVLGLVYDALLSSLCFICSHPLYLAYLIYWSPRILRLLSFLFPLLLSTSILLFLFSLHSILQCQPPTVCTSMLVAAIGDVFEWEFETMADLYYYGNNNVDQISEAEDDKHPLQISVENPAKTELLQLHVGNGGGVGSKDVSSLELNLEVAGDQIANCEAREDKPVDHVNSKGCSFVPQTPDRNSEIMGDSTLARRVKRRSATFEMCSKSGSMRSRSMKITSELDEQQRQRSTQKRSDGILSELSKSKSEKGGRLLEREASRRNEKEWKRTLACKLYEERRGALVVEGTEEEMDLLWETHEFDAEKKGKNIDKIEEEEEDDESVLVKRQVCCLQALRPNLGIGRPNLSRISKVFKGIGFLHRSGSGSSRRSRKI